MGPLSLAALGFLLFLPGLLGQTGNGEGENRAPRFTHDMNYHAIPENTQVGSPVYPLKGIDPEGAPLTFGIISDMFEVNETTGIVYLKSKLDYETATRYRASVWISDGASKTTHDITVDVQDYNDMWPKFSEQTYKVSVKENAEIGTTVLPNISVTDVDKVNELLRVRCLTQLNKETVTACTTYFEVKKVREQSDNRKWLGHLILKGRLDYEKNSVFQVPLEAWDGRNAEVKSVEVSVEDVQDTPPKFTVQLTPVLNEGSPRGTLVIDLNAVDGDTASPRAIRYELGSNPGNLFQINRNSGRVTLTRTLDRESSLFSTGSITFEVKAREVLSESGTLGNDMYTQTTASVTLTVRDINDNAPQFSPSRFDVNIPEDIATGTPLPGLTDLRVTDADQGSNAEFSLSLDGFTDVFEVYPTRGIGSVTVSVRVKDGSKIDYDRGRRQYPLHIVATEIRTPEKRKGHAYVTVNIQDVNDNMPTFEKSSYTASVSELAPFGTSIITITGSDPDSGTAGSTGLRYFLVGNGAEKFVANQITGMVTVASCFPMGSGSCLDYETKNRYDLTFQARDLQGGNTVSTSLTINVLDENDNTPRCDQQINIGYINEGESSFQPRFQIKATDADSSRNDNNRIHFTILGGNVEEQFAIDRKSGILTAVVPVDYEKTPNKQGYYLLTIQVKDGKQGSTCTAKIMVRDSNDHPPKFIQAKYVQYISENTRPGTIVETVKATDADPPTSPNGQINYRIEWGSQDKFVIDRTTGVIRVQSGATFDYDVQNKYTMSVLASDRGQPQRTAGATVEVNIIDTNNKKPYFQPSTVRVSVYENKKIDTSVTVMKATDPDSGAELHYSFVEPIEGYTRLGQNVTGTMYKRQFRIQELTGLVSVNMKLDYEQMVRWKAVVQAVDYKATPRQTASGTLIVNILDVNDKKPVFPGTKNGQLSISTREEQPTGSFVTRIVATDDTDAISEYRIIEDQGGYFAINSLTGVVSIQKRIDYERIQSTRFVVIAVDNGQPQMTATATVNVRIINLNDNNPIFNLTSTHYTASIPENSPGGTPVIQVRASDADLGDYGIVKYMLGDPQKRFVINSDTGLITVAAGAKLDRESTPVIAITAIAYDSPNNKFERRATSVPVYITLTDVNDNKPRFSQTYYYRRLAGNTPVQTSVIQLEASDYDSSDNRRLVFIKTAGDQKNLFYVNRTTGLIKTVRALTGQSGIHNMTVQVQDQGGKPGAQTNLAYVIVTVYEANNMAPRWIIPAFNNYTRTVLEQQYPGMRVINVQAVDTDLGENGRISYSFEVNGVQTLVTPDFIINSVSGIITAKDRFDKEKKDTYTLLLVATDGGKPAKSSKRYLTIKIGDVDDNFPTFPQYHNCCTIPYRFFIQENNKPVKDLGIVKAIDKDVGAEGHVTYKITGGNVGNAFTINSTTGMISTRKSLDFEQHKQYTLMIEAGKIPEQKYARFPSRCGCYDPYKVKVIVTVIDVNDNKPIFSHGVYNACVAAVAPNRTLVTQVVATDSDVGQGGHIRYYLRSLTAAATGGAALMKVTADEFHLGLTSGSVYTNALMQKFVRHYFVMGINAVDGGGLSSPTKLRVWVTEAKQEVVITQKMKLKEVQLRLPALIKLISESTSGGIVCINGLRYHVDSNGNVKVDWTDIFIHVIDGRTLTVIDANILINILWRRLEGGTYIRPKMEGLQVTDVKASIGGGTLWGVAVDPVLIAVILVLILLLIGLLLLCCLVCCLPWCMKKKRGYKEMKEPFIATGTINPLWKQKLYEDQEMAMSIHTIDTRKGGATYVNPAYRGDEVDTSHAQQNGMAMLAVPGRFENGTAVLALPGSHSETREQRMETMTTTEYTYQKTTTGTQQASDMVDGTDIRIEAPLEPRQDVGQMDAIPVSYTSTMPRLPSQVTTDYNSLRAGAYSTLGYGYTAAHHPMSHGLVSVGDIGYRPNSASTNRSYAEEALLIQDLRSPSLSPSPPPMVSMEGDSLYQGEIHLGTLHVPQPEVRQETTHQEFVETREYHQQYQVPMVHSNISNAITYQ